MNQRRTCPPRTGTQSSGGAGRRLGPSPSPGSPLVSSRARWRRRTSCPWDSPRRSRSSPTTPARWGPPGGNRHILAGMMAAPVDGRCRCRTATARGRLCSAPLPCNAAPPAARQARPWGLPASVVLAYRLRLSRGPQLPGHPRWRNRSDRGSRTGLLSMRRGWCTRWLRRFSALPVPGCARGWFSPAESRAASTRLRLFEQRQANVVPTLRRDDRAPTTIRVSREDIPIRNHSDLACRSQTVCLTAIAPRIRRSTCGLGPAHHSRDPGLGRDQSW